MVHKEGVAGGTASPVDVCPMSEAVGLSLSEDIPEARPPGLPLSPAPEPSQSFLSKTTVPPSEGSSLCTDWLRFISP